MVRVLSCHHFHSQSIGKCEEGVLGLGLAGNVVIVGTEQLISVFCTNQKNGATGAGAGVEGKLGESYVYKEDADAVLETAAPEVPGAGGELTLSHSFAPVDLICSISYNPRAHYLLCLEKRESDGNGRDFPKTVRIYFQWDNSLAQSPGKAMKARIAGLVSPGGGSNDDSEIDDIDGLIMIEIPAPPPPPPPLAPVVEPSIIVATTSCSTTGNLATLSTDSRVHIYEFKIKESGRGRRKYADFDLVLVIQAHGFSPGPEKIVLVQNVIGLMSGEQVEIIRVVKNPVIPLPVVPETEPEPLPQAQTDSDPDSSTVHFNSKDQSIKVYLRSIVHGNRKRRQPNSWTLEEFQDEITTSKTTICGGAGAGAADFYEAQDLLRLSVINKSGGQGQENNFRQILLHPLRIQNKSGGCSCFIATSKEAFLYHISDSSNSSTSGNNSNPARRVMIYQFTAPLVQLTFDYSFLHAFTETGLETYSSGGILTNYFGDNAEENENILRDLLSAGPCLLGVRPWPALVQLQHMDSNDGTLVIVASPGTASPIEAAEEAENESVERDTKWTIYSLTLPSIDSITTDTLRVAELHHESNPEAYFSIIYELYLYLRLQYQRKFKNFQKSHLPKYHQITKQIGFECFRKSTKEEEPQNRDDWIQKGIKFLQLGNCDIQSIFGTSSSPGIPKDPALIPGICKFILSTLPRNLTEGPSTSVSIFSPSFTKIIIEFLENHSPESLVKLVIEVPWIRECQGTKLLTILRILAVNSNYSAPETLALILTIVTVHGSDSDAIEEINAILQKTRQSDLESLIPVEWILETNTNPKNPMNQVLVISDLSICFVMSRSKIHINVISSALTKSTSQKLPLNQTILAFLQGVNLNSDPEVKDGLSSGLANILENYFLNKLEEIVESECQISEDENRALNTLIQSYLGHIFQNSAQSGTGSNGRSESVDIEAGVPGPSQKQAKPSPSQLSPFLFLSNDEQKSWQIWGKIPSFINSVLEDGNPGEGSFGMVGSKENFVKLASLLGSPLGSVDGIKEFILNFLSTKIPQGQKSSPICSALQLLCEKPENVIGILTEKYPAGVVLYGKEILKKNTHLWKFLVVKLKEIIHSNSNGGGQGGPDIYSTVIESVYLHLANTFSPTELEEILDKEEENAKIYGACKRIELANTFTEKVVKMSKDYLNQV